MSCSYYLLFKHSKLSTAANIYYNGIGIIGPWCLKIQQNELHLSFFELCFSMLYVILNIDHMIIIRFFTEDKL